MKEIKPNAFGCHVIDSVCDLHEDAIVCKHGCKKSDCKCEEYIKNSFTITNQDVGSESDEGFGPDGLGDDDEGVMDPIDQYVLCLKVNGIEYEAIGKTVLHAMSKIIPDQMKTRGIWILKHRDKQSQRAMYPLMIKRLLVNKTQQLMFQKMMVNTLH